MTDFKDGYIEGLQAALNLAKLSAEYNTEAADVAEAIESLLTKTKNQ